MRVVLDTNVLVAALRSSSGASYAILARLPSPIFQVALSVPVYLEYLDVLTRPEVLPIGIQTKQINGFLRYIAKMAHHQEIYFLWRPFLPDAKDDMILELAVAAQCSHLITHNTRHFVGADQFGIQVHSPSMFLKYIQE